MAVSATQFYWELYEEYLDEGSFLYEQRVGLYDDIELTWLDLEDFEDRIEAHIDGLVVGEGLALDVAKEKADGAEAGELFIILCLFCRQNRKDWLEEVISALDAGDPEIDKAVVDALVIEAPFEWVQEWSRNAEFVNDLYWFNILVQIVGLRRYGVGEFLTQHLTNQSAQEEPQLDVVKNLVVALGRIAHVPAIAALHPYLEHDDEALQAEAVLSLLRIGDKRAVDQLLEIVAQPESPKWALRLLAMSAGPRESKVLLASPLSEGTAIALGWLGDAAAVPVLLRALESDFAEAAAEALQVITGANLEEEALIPEEIDEDLLTKKELEKHQAALAAGKPSPLIDPDDPPGETIERLSQDPQQWIKWWEKNERHFNAGQRYREGALFSPAALMDQLLNEDAKLPRLREYAMHEMVIRYGLNSQFELELPVKQQQALFKEWLPGIQAATRQYTDGHWYFAGKVLKAEGL